MAGPANFSAACWVGQEPYHIAVMASLDPRTINRRGCLALGVFLLILSMIAGWIATKTPDGAASDEAMSRASKI